MNTFRLSNKKVYNDSRSTIENLHNEKMDQILLNSSTLEAKKKKLEYLNQKLKLLKSDNSNNNQINIKKISSDINKLENEMYSIDNNHE